MPIRQTFAITSNSAAAPYWTSAAIQSRSRGSCLPAEPRRVLGLIERDPVFGTDTLTAGVLEFAQGHSTFTCSTRLAPYQRMIFFGTEGRIEVLIPFNAPNDRPTEILLNSETIEFPVCDQYEIQGSRFSQALRENREQPIPLEDAISNMAVIDAVFRSATTGQWEDIQ